ncbi:MAG: anaerobic ribonucleoside-triphosphate reductase [bacterium]
MVNPDNNFLFPEETWRSIQPKLMFRRIQKRDGTIVDFDKTKITNAIFAAAQSVGGKDSELADSLADLVILYLARTYQDGLLNVEQVQDAIEKVLIENGHARTVKSFILYRAERQRVRQRNQTEPRSTQAEMLQDKSPKPEIDSSLQVRTSDDQIMAWNRQRIIDALVRETQLNPETAARISKEVEIQIIESKLRVITAGLIRELVNAKLLESGFEKEQRLHTRLGIPLYDFEQLLFAAETKPEKSIDKIVIESLSKQYAFAKVFSQEVIAAHTDGTIYLHGLEKIGQGYLFRYYCGINDKIENQHSQSWNSISTIEKNWVVSESELTLSVIEDIIETCKESNVKLRIVKNRGETPTPEFVVHKISLNLPRIAYFVSQNKTETYLFCLLQSQLDLIVGAHRQKQQIVNRIYGARLADQARNDLALAVTPQIVYAIGIVGLNELVQAFTGEQLHQSESAIRFGIKTLSELKEICQQLSVAFNIPLVLEPTYAPEIASRFAKLDLKRYQLLANQVAKKKPTNGGGTYTLGAHFAEEANLDILSRIDAESRLYPYLNNQGKITIPKTYLETEIARLGKNWLISFLKLVYQETNNQDLIIEIG